MNNGQNQSFSEPEDGHNFHVINFTALSLFILLLNMFLMALMLWKKKLRKMSSNKLLLNLLISDGIVCVSYISHSVKLMVNSNDATSLLEVYLRKDKTILLLGATVLLSILNLTLITLDRLIAVKWPFFYEDRIRSRQVCTAIGVVWGITISYGIVIIILVNVFDFKASQYAGSIFFTVIVITGFLTLLISNYFVFSEARKHLKALEKISIKLSDDSGTHKNKCRAKEFRLARINFGLVLSFFLFWINSLILNIKKLVHFNEEEYHINIGYILTSIYLVKVYYICNPMWYVALSQEVKREVKRIFIKKNVEKVTNSRSVQIKTF